MFTNLGDSICKWISNSVLTILPDLTVNVGLVISVLPDRIRPFRGGNYTVTSSISISTPLQPKSPSVILSSPAHIGSCSDLIIDPTGSFGNGGRAWATMRWAVYTDNTNGNNGIEVKDFLNKNFNSTSNLVVIPRRLLHTGVSYTVTLYVTNFLGASSMSSSVSTTVNDDPTVPVVSIYGMLELSCRLKTYDKYF